MAVWDVLRNLPPPPPRKKAHPEQSVKKSFQSFQRFCGYYRGLDLIPVKLELDTAGKVTVRCKSLKTGILRFVGEHEAELAQVLADMPGRQWDSMTDRVEELITRVQRMQNAG